MIHIHARTPDGVPSLEVEDFGRSDAIRGAVDDVIVNYSIGAIGIRSRSGSRICASCGRTSPLLNMGSMNDASIGEAQGLRLQGGVQNSFDTIIEFVTVMNELGIASSTTSTGTWPASTADRHGALGEPLQVSA